jgi:methylase of polypeptide subunit release factors
MTPDELQRFLRAPFDAGGWLTLLKDLLPSTQVFGQPQPLAFGVKQVVSASQLARIELADQRKVAVLEVQVSGQVDLQRNRVGLRNLVARFIDQQQAHAVLGFFRGDSPDYRFSCVARTSEIGEDGQLSRNETAPRRYTYLLGPGQPCRTLTERIGGLRAHGGTIGMPDLLAAFKVEPLFKEFFREYGRDFDRVENFIRPSLSDKEALRLFTQRLFNRLMFLAFIERKGWLHFGNRTDYLAALWDDYRNERSKSRGTSTFYADRLRLLFFSALNNSQERDLMAINRGGLLRELVGNVPYLNGGLFDPDAEDNRPGVVVPDEAIAAILDPESGLFSRYNFTVAESTPLEIDVAVDPEMLGKVFEELVTGRHEQGSYYTPKPIVSFMCREALVEYLADRCPAEARPALEAFVHEHQPAELRDREAIEQAVNQVTVCDPACGSGAYLLGMLHELIDLRTCIFGNGYKLDATTAHEKKLQIIERNLYGVDLDAFAVNVARLRLWLSLVVDFEGNTPPPLPNLDFKIEQGDSLAAAAPADISHFSSRLVRELREKKAAYLRAHGVAKDKLHREIADKKAAFDAFREGPVNAFHWASEFAEVFEPAAEPATEKSSSGAGARGGGFDIVVANPPYVRMELIKPQKPILRKRFPHVHAERADLYIYFYARAHELLRPGGVAAFISSNKWLRAGYGEALRQHLLDEQAFKVVMDFGDLPVFESATAYPCVFVWQKKLRGDTSTRWATIKDLDACYAEGVRASFLRLAVAVPASQFGKGKSRLSTGAAADLRERMDRSGPRLGELCRGLLGWGVKTGLNDAFVLDGPTRDRLIAETPASEEIIKPLLVGEDVRRYELQYRGAHLIYAFHGVDIRRYPSVERHLRPFRSFKNDKGETVGLEHRATEQKWFELQQPQMAYREWFDRQKILYPEIGLRSRFAMDERGLIINNKAFFLPTAEWFVLAVLNSSTAWTWFAQTLSPLRGGYLEFRAQYLETLPIPDASAADRKTVGALAKKAQALHGQRRARVEKFLRAIGLDPAQSTSRNPLEQPWTLSSDEFARRAKKQPAKLHESARDETAALTEQIAKVEAEIDARVAALYGLDAEDRRWSAKATPSAQTDDKQSLFFLVLGRLKEQRAYFPYEAIQAGLNDEELALKDSSLSVYLTEAVKQGLVHDAGRGWYSRLADRVALDSKPVAKLVRAVEKAFPLLDFTVWSTAQVNPWMHHLLAQPVAFLHAPADTLESIGEALVELKWNVAIDPPPSTAAKSVRPGEKTVVLRPTLSKQPSAEDRQAPIEKILVDLIVEAPLLALMDISEAQAVVRNVLDVHLANIASIQRYADSRHVIMEAISQRHSSASSGVS